MKNKVSNISWAKSVVNILYEKGVKHVSISPGSRNTPLTLAFIKHLGIKCFSHIDERAGAYFSVGLSKKAGVPVAVLTTSGTATANLFPGIIEAEASNLPLIILTADRPTKLVNTGETQTIDQKNLYGKHVKKMMDIDHRYQSPKLLLEKIDELLHLALGYDQSIPGPIHLNFRFDLPLIDEDKSIIKINKKLKAKRIQSEKLIPYSFKRPLIICGPMNIHEPITNIIKFAKKINAPIFADSLSQLRYGNSSINVMSYYEFYLDIVNKPDIIFRFGEKPTPKSLNNLLDQNKKITYLINPYGNYNDDCTNISKISLTDIISNIHIKDNNNKEWLNTFIKKEKRAEKIIDSKIAASNTQAKIINETIKKLRKRDNIFIGNSTTIRIFNKFSGKSKNQVNILGNNKTRGIDGILASALGMSWANKKGNNVLFIGDLSLFYDMNAFHILKNESINLTVIVFNNKGGQIFTQLPYSNKIIKGFEKFWLTPVNTSIKNLAKLFSIKYYNCNFKSFNNDIEKILLKQGIKIIEVKINTKTDVKFIYTINKMLN